MAKFTWGDSAQVTDDAPAVLRPGSQVAIVGVIEPLDRRGSYFDNFAEGVIYTIEFEDGSSADTHEDYLLPLV